MIAIIIIQYHVQYRDVLKCISFLRRSRAYKRGYNVRRGSEDYREDYQNDDYHNNDANDDNDDDHEHDHVKAMSQPKVDYWAGYYDFLINEGSYKFWAVFQVLIFKFHDHTIALSSIIVSTRILFLIRCLI